MKQLARQANICLLDNVYTSDILQGMNMARDKQLNIRMTKEEKKLLDKDAKEQERSISNLLLWCWKEWRKAKGKK